MQKADYVLPFLKILEIKLEPRQMRADHRPQTTVRGLSAGHFLRAISLSTAILFLCSEILTFPAQSFAYQSTDGRSQTAGQNFLLQSPVSGLQVAFFIPPELGTISEAYRGERGTGNEEREGASVSRSPLAVPRHDRTVVLIQDAHAVPDAQRSLMKLIEHFQSKYGIRQVALEGAEGKLDPELFRNFPDKEKLAKVFNSYLDSGELSGAAVASVLLPTQTDYVGIEDWDLYQKGITSFLRGLEKQADLKSQISNLKEKLQELKKKYYAPKALEFDEHYENWRQKQDDFAGFLNYLVETLRFDSKRYSSLDAVIQGLRHENIPDNSALNREIRALAAKIQPKLVNKEVQAKFNELKQSLQTGNVGKVEFARGLKELFPGDDLGISTELLGLIENHEEILRLQGAEFVSEFEKAIAEAKSSVFISADEKETNALSEQVIILEKLTKFELSRSEWKTLQGYGVRGTAYGEPVENPIASFVPSADIPSLQAKILILCRSPLIADFFSFYAIALQREAVFVKHIENLLRTPYAVHGMVVVAGGFHTEGLAQKFREQGISYVVVSPRINEIPKDSRYFDYMKGQVSWREYFKPKSGRVDLYDAFVQAMTERLISPSTKHQIPSAQHTVQRTFRSKIDLKDWRDSVIRRLAAEGRVAEHSKYTRYIDQQLAGQSEEFQALKEKWTARLEQFIGKLQLLGKQNQLTEANIARLFTATANFPAATASLVPGASVPVNFVDDQRAQRATRNAQREEQRKKSLSGERSALPAKEVPIPKEAVLDETSVEPGQSSASVRSEVRVGQAEGAMKFDVSEVRELVLNGKAVTPDQFHAKVTEMSRGGFIFNAVIRDHVLRLGVARSSVGGRRIYHAEINDPSNHDDAILGFVPEPGPYQEISLVYKRFRYPDQEEREELQDQMILFARVFIQQGFPGTTFLGRDTLNILEGIEMKLNVKRGEETFAKLAALPLSSEKARSGLLAERDGSVPLSRAEARQNDAQTVPEIPTTVNATPQNAERQAELEKYLAGKTLIHSVFEGGGAKGVAYVGALEELENKKMWFKEVAGTSAGAITASLIAAGYEYPKIKEIVFNTDFNQFKDKRWGIVPPWLNFLVFGGLYRGLVFEKWIAGKMKEKLGFEPTLKDLPIPLTVITSDITNKNMLILNRETAPDLKVAEAVRMSMGIPFFFEVYKWFGFYKKFPLAVRRTVDGGLLSNFPLFIYDKAGSKGEPVVGFMLQEIPHKKKSSWITKLLALLKYLPPFHIAIAVIDTALDGHDNRHIEDDVWAKIVNIPVDVGTLDFDLTLAQKEELAARGKEATKKIIGLAMRGEKGKVDTPAERQFAIFRSKGGRIFFKPAGFTCGVQLDLVDFYLDGTGEIQSHIKFHPEKRILIQPKNVWETNLKNLRSPEGKWIDASLVEALEPITKNTVFNFDTRLNRDFILFDPRTRQEIEVIAVGPGISPADKDQFVLSVAFPPSAEIIRYKNDVRVVRRVPGDSRPGVVRSEVRMSPAELGEEFKKNFPFDHELMLAMFGEMVVEDALLKAFFDKLIASERHPVSEERARYLASLLRIDQGWDEERTLTYRVRRGKKTASESIPYSGLQQDFLDWAVKMRISRSEFPLAYGFYVEGIEAEKEKQGPKTVFKVMAGNKLGDAIFKKVVERRKGRPKQPLTFYKGDVASDGDLRWLKTLKTTKDVPAVLSSSGIGLKDLRLGFHDPEFLMQEDTYDIFLFTTDPVFINEAASVVESRLPTTTPVGYAQVQVLDGVPTVSAFQPRFYLPHSVDPALKAYVEGSMKAFGLLIEANIKDILRSRKPVTKIRFLTPGYFLNGLKAQESTIQHYYFTIPKSLGYSLKALTEPITGGYQHINFVFEKEVASDVSASHVRPIRSETRNTITDLAVVAEGLSFALPHYFGSSLMVIRGNAGLLELAPDSRENIAAIEKGLRDLTAKLKILRGETITVLQNKDGKNYVWLSNEGFSRKILRGRRSVTPEVWQQLKKQLGLDTVFAELAATLERIGSKIENPDLSPEDISTILESCTSISSLVHLATDKAKQFVSTRSAPILNESAPPSEARDSFWDKPIQLRPKYVAAGIVGIIAVGVLLGIKLSGITWNELKYMTTTPVEVKRFITDAARVVRVTKVRKVDNEAEYVPMFSYRIKPRSKSLYTDGTRSCAALIIDDPSGGRHFLGHFGTTQSPDSIRALITDNFQELGGLQVYVLEGNQPGMDRTIFAPGAYATIKNIYATLKDLGLLSQTKYIPKNTNPHWGSRIFVQDGELFLPNHDADYPPPDDSDGSTKWILESEPRSELRQGEFSELLSQIQEKTVAGEERLKIERVEQWSRAVREVAEANFYDKTAEPFISHWEWILGRPEIWEVLAASDSLDPLLDGIESGHSPKAMRMPNLIKSAIFFSVLGLSTSALFGMEESSTLVRGFAVFALVQILLVYAVASATKVRRVRTQRQEQWFLETIRPKKIQIENRFHELAKFSWVDDSPEEPILRPGLGTVSEARSELREEKALAAIHKFAHAAKEQVKEFAKKSIAAKQRVEWELRRHGKIENKGWFAQALGDLNERGRVFDQHVDEFVADRDDVLSVVNGDLLASVVEPFSYEYQAMKKELGLILKFAMGSEKDGLEWTSLEHHLNDLSLVLLEMMDTFETIAMLPELDLRDGIVDMTLNQSDPASQVNEKKYSEQLKPVFQKSSHVYEEVLKLKENGVLFEIFPFLRQIAGFQKRDGSIIIDHLLNLIRCLEWIEKGDRAAFNEGTLGWVVEAQEFQLYQKLFSEASAGEGRELLYLVALLHNIGEISRVEDWKDRESFQVRQALFKFDHSEAGGAYLIRPIIRRKLGFSTQVMKDRMKMVEWLVFHQFALGNLFFGELSPSHLLAKMVAMPPGVDQAKLFKMLTILSFADLRNTYRGAYITKFKTNFYAGMMNFETLWLILQRLDEYRLQRFITGPDGSPDPQKQIALDEIFYGKLPASLQNHLKHVLRYGVHRFYFGAFLFRSIKVETLLKLLVTISAFFKAPGVELRDVAFTTPSAEAETVADQLDAFFDPLSFQEIGSFFGMDVHKIQGVLAERGLPVEIREATEELVIDTKALLRFSTRPDSKNRAEMRTNEIDPKTLPERERVRLVLEYIKSKGQAEAARGDLPGDLLQEIFEKYDIKLKSTKKGKSISYDFVDASAKPKSKPRIQSSPKIKRDGSALVTANAEIDRQKALLEIQNLKRAAGLAMQQAQKNHDPDQYAVAVAKHDEIAARLSVFGAQMQSKINFHVQQARRAKELRAEEEARRLISLSKEERQALEDQARQEVLKVEGERIAKEKVLAEERFRLEQEKKKLEDEQIAREEAFRKQREEEARQLLEAERKEREAKVAKAKFEAHKSGVIKLIEEADVRLTAFDAKDFTGIKSIREMKEISSAIKAVEEFRAKYGKDGDLEGYYGIFGSSLATKEADYTQWRQNNEKLLAIITRNPAVLLDRIRSAEKKRSRNEPLEPVETRKAVEASFKVIMEAAMADIGSRDTFTEQDAATMGLLKKIRAALDVNQSTSRSEVRQKKGLGKEPPDVLGVREADIIPLDLNADQKTTFETFWDYENGWEGVARIEGGDPAWLDSEAGAELYKRISQKTRVLAAYILFHFPDGDKLVLREMADANGRPFFQTDERKLAFILNEMAKNAIVHGHKLNLQLPVFLQWKFDLKERVFRIRVVNAIEKDDSLIQKIGPEKLRDILKLSGEGKAEEVIYHMTGGNIPARKDVGNATVSELEIRLIIRSEARGEGTEGAGKLDISTESREREGYTWVNGDYVQYGKKGGIWISGDTGKGKSFLTIKMIESGLPFKVVSCGASYFKSHEEGGKRIILGLRGEMSANTLYSRLLGYKKVTLTEEMVVPLRFIVTLDDTYEDSYIRKELKGEGSAEKADIRIINLTDLDVSRDWEEAVRRIREVVEGTSRKVKSVKFVDGSENASSQPRVETAQATAGVLPRGISLQIPRSEVRSQNQIQSEIDRVTELKNGARMRARQFLQYNRELIQWFLALKDAQGKITEESKEEQTLILEKIRDYADVLREIAGNIRPDVGEGIVGEQTRYQKLNDYAVKPSLGIRQEEVTIALTAESRKLKEDMAGLQKQFLEAHRAKDPGRLRSLNEQAVALYKARLKAQLLQASSYLQEQKIDTTALLTILTAIRIGYLKISHEYGWRIRRALGEAAIQKIQVVGREGDVAQVYDYENFKMATVPDGKGEQNPVTIFQDVWVRKDLEDGSFTYQPEKRPFVFKDLKTAVRRSFHILLNQEVDFAQVYDRINDLDYIVDLLRTDGDEIPEYYLEDIRESVDFIMNARRGSLTRGHVDEKGNAAANVRGGMFELEARHTARATEMFGAAKKELETRLIVLAGKKAGISSQAQYLIHRYRRDETSRAMRELGSLLEEQNFQAAYQLLRVLYKTHYLHKASEESQYASLQWHVIDLGVSLKRLALKKDRPSASVQGNILRYVRENIRRIQIMAGANLSDPPSPLRNEGRIHSASRAEMRLKQPLRAVVFDIGGVIFDLDFKKMAQALINAGVRIKTVEEIIALSVSSDVYKALERDEISPEAFYAALCGALGIGILSYEEFVRIWTDIFTPKPETVELIKQARETGAKIFFLTDANRLHTQYLKKHYPDVFALADHVFPSYELGLRKGDGSRVFQVVSEKLEQEYGIKHGEYVFFDDRNDNVAAANSVGFPAMVFESAQAAREELAKSEEVTPDEIQSDLTKIDLAGKGSSRITSIDEAGLLVTGKRQEVSEPWTNRRARLTYILREGLKPYRDVLPALTDSLKDGARHGGKYISFSMVSPRFGYAGTSTDYLNYGPSSGKNGYSLYNVAFILDPAYVRRHQEDFHAVGEAFAANGTMHKAYIDSKGEVLGGFTYRSGIAEQITRPAPYPDEVVVDRNIPPEAFGAIIAHDAYAKEIRDIIVTECPQMSIRIFNPKGEILFDIKSDTTTTLRATSEGKRSEVRSEPAPEGTPTAGFNEGTRQQLLKSIAHFIQVIDTSSEAQLKAMEQVVINHMGKFDKAEDILALMGALVGIWDRLSKISGERSASETQLKAMEQFVINHMGKFDKAEDILALMGALVGIWDRLSKISGALPAKNSLSETQLKSIEQFVFDSMKKSDKPEDILAFMSVLVDVWVRFSKIPDVSPSIYKERIGYLIGNIFKGERLLDKDTNQNDISLFEKYVGAATTSDIITLNDILRELADRMPEIEPGGLTEEELKLTRALADYELLEKRKTIGSTIGRKIDDLKRLGEEASRKASEPPVSDNVGSSEADLQSEPPDFERNALGIPSAPLPPSNVLDGRDRLEAAVAIMGHGGPLDIADQIHNAGLLQLMDYVKALKGDVDFEKEKALEQALLQKARLYYSFAYAMQKLNRPEETNEEFLTLVTAGLRQEEAPEVQRIFRRLVENGLDPKEREKAFIAWTREVDGLLQGLRSEVERIDPEKFSAGEIARVQEAGNIYNYGDESVGRFEGIKRNYIALAKRWQFNFKAMASYLAPEGTADFQELNLPAWILQRTWETKQEAHRVVARPPVGRLPGVFVNEELLHLAIERIISNGFRAINEQASSLPGGFEKVDIDTEAIRGIDGRENVQIRILSPGVIPDSKLKINEARGMQELFVLDPKRSHFNHNIAMPFVGQAIKGLGGKIFAENITTGGQSYAVVTIELPAGRADRLAKAGESRSEVRAELRSGNSEGPNIGSASEDLRVRNYEEVKVAERIMLRSGEKVRTFTVRGSFHLTDDTTLNLAVDEESGKLYVIRKLLTEEDEDHCSYVPKVMEKLKGYEGVYQAEWMVKADDSNGWDGRDASLNGAIVYPYIPGKDLASIFEGYKKLPPAAYFSELLDIVIRVADIGAYIEAKGIYDVWSIKPENIMITPDGKLVLIDYTRKKINPLSSIEFLLYDSTDGIHMKGIDGVLPTLKFVSDPALNRQIVSRLTAAHRKVKANSYENIGQFSEELKGVKALMEAGDSPGSATPQPQGDVRSEVRGEKDLLWTKPALDAKPDPVAVVNRQFKWWTKRTPAWTEEEILKIPEVIKALYDAGINLRGGSIQMDKSEEGKKTVQSVLGTPRTASAIYTKTLQLYKDKGKWPAALREAGIDPAILPNYPGAIEERNMKFAQEEQAGKRSAPSLDTEERIRPGSKNRAEVRVEKSKGKQPSLANLIRTVATAPMRYAGNSIKTDYGAVAFQKLYGMLREDPEAVLSGMAGLSAALLRQFRNSRRGKSLISFFPVLNESQSSQPRSEVREKKYDADWLRNAAFLFDSTDPELRAVLNEVLGDDSEALTPRQREVLRKRYWEGMTISQIAEEEGKSRNAISDVAWKAILRLRHYLDGKGYFKLNSSADFQYLLMGKQSRAARAEVRSEPSEAKIPVETKTQLDKEEARPAEAQPVAEVKKPEEIVPVQETPLPVSLPILPLVETAKPVDQLQTERAEVPSQVEPAAVEEIVPAPKIKKARSQKASAKEKAGDRILSKELAIALLQELGIAFPRNSEEVAEVFLRLYEDNYMRAIEALTWSDPAKAVARAERLIELIESLTEKTPNMPSRIYKRFEALIATLKWFRDAAKFAGSIEQPTLMDRAVGDDPDLVIEQVTNMIEKVEEGRERFSAPPVGFDRALKAWQDRLLGIQQLAMNSKDEVDTVRSESLDSVNAGKEEDAFTKDQKRDLVREALEEMGIQEVEMKKLNLVRIFDFCNGPGVEAAEKLNDYFDGRGFPGLSDQVDDLILRMKAVIAQENEDEEDTGGNDYGFVRSETRLQQVYAGVLGTVLRQDPDGKNLVREFTEEVREAGVEMVSQGLWTTFNNIVLPEAMAAMTVSDTNVQVAGYDVLENVLRQKDLSRETLDRIAEQMFNDSLKDLVDAILKREIGGMAPVVFYSSEMKTRLIHFIETVQQGFESIGDVTGENYRITLVSANKAELRILKTELSKRGALRGVQFIEDKGLNTVARELASSVIRHPVFGVRFGIFFPESGLGQNVTWQWVVRSEIPKEYAVLLLPALSRYFASVPTSQISAATLRQALPDLFASAAFRVGQGIAIVASFLEHIAAAEKQFAASA